MRPRSRKTTLIAVAGSVALASAAYGIGSQSGGGNSGAATAPGFRPVRGTRMIFHDREESLAKRLGVSEARLRAALGAIRKSEQRSGNDPRSQFEKALAGALGVPVSKVQDAFDKLQAQHRDAFAKRLGVKSSALHAALEKVRSQLESQMHARRDRLATQLADKLGIPVQKVKDAFAAEMQVPPWKEP